MNNDTQNMIKPLALGLMGLLVGVMFSSQSKSVQEVQNAFDRDARANFFKEIEILKSGNQSLQDELRTLDQQLLSGNDQEAALKKLQEDIVRYSLIAGVAPAQGEGVRIKIDGKLQALWFTDLINELYSAGAETISINGVRVARKSNGFDNIPNGKILIGGKDISAPFEILAIGKSSVLQEALSQPDGIIFRMNKFMPDNKVSVETALQLTI